MRELPENKPIPVMVREEKKDVPNGKTLPAIPIVTKVKYKDNLSDLEKSDLVDALDTWLLAYQNKHNNKTERQRPRMRELKAKLEAQP